MGETLAILGCGKIGEILVSGLLASGWRRPEEIVVTARREERVAELVARHGLRATRSNPEAAADARTLVISVKPQDMEALVSEIAEEVTTDHLIISIAAAIPTRFLEKRLVPGVPVVRAMPNAPAQVGEGIAGLCPGSHATDEHLKVAEE
ncbi:MAG: pyrroline-5-carboxylate reductase family protein, partial [Actinomycetota bacterium]